MFKIAYSATIGQMNIHFKIAANSLAQLLSRVISAAAVLVLTFLITKNLSRDVWGDFVTITSYLGLFVLITDFGINGAVLKKLIQNEENEEIIYKNLFGLRIVLALLSIFISIAVLSFLPYSPAIKMGIIFGTIYFVSQSIVNTTSAIFQLRMRYDLFAISDILGSLALVFLAFLAIKLGFGLFGVVLVYILGSIVKALVSMFFVESVFNLRGFSFDISVWKSILISSLPLGLMLIFSQINANIDKQIIALTPASVVGAASASIAIGIYGLAYKIFDFSIAFPTQVADSAYPVILQNQKENNQVLERNSRNLSLILFGLGVLITIVGWFLASLIPTIFGNYSESILTLRILLLGLPFFYVTAFFVRLVITLGKENTLPFIYGFAALTNVVFNLIYIPKFGYNAAAWVTNLTEVLIFALLFIVISTKLNLLKTNENTEK